MTRGEAPREASSIEGQGAEQELERQPENPRQTEKLSQAASATVHELSNALLVVSGRLTLMRELAASGGAACLRAA